MLHGFVLLNLETNKIPQVTKVTKTVEFMKTESYKSSTIDGSTVPKTYTNVEHHEIEGDDLHKLLANKRDSNDDRRFNHSYGKSIADRPFTDFKRKDESDDEHTEANSMAEVPPRMESEKFGLFGNGSHRWNTPDMKNTWVDEGVTDFRSRRSAEYGDPGLKNGRPGVEGLPGSWRTFGSENTGGRGGDEVVARSEVMSDKNQAVELMIKPEMVGYEEDELTVPRSLPEDMVLQQEVERTLKVHEVETTDEITVETKVTQVKTINMRLSEVGDISVTETSEVKTDTDMKETRKTKERDELIMSHRMLDQPATEPLRRSPPTPLFSTSLPTRTEQASPSAYSPRFSTSADKLPNDLGSSEYPRFSRVAATPAFDDIGDRSLYIAMSYYEPESDDVMSLHEGEKVEVLDDVREDWWVVRKMFDSRQGTVPSHYLKEKGDHDRSVEQHIMSYIGRIPSESSKRL